MASSRMFLFGGSKAWNPADWTSSDDRVRGGSSQSYLTCTGSSPTARFHGTLDIKTLGGAGFASQRTTGEDRSWDLSAYDGIELDVEDADSKRYTFILKDELLPKNPENGREQSTISYEYDFQVQKDEHSQSSSSKGTKIVMPWDALKATYRGKEKRDAAPLDTKNIKRLSVMMRSFFGDQEGDFALSIRSIAAVKIPKPEERSYPVGVTLSEKGMLPLWWRDSRRREQGVSPVLKL
ncbi:hypothetical protein H2201_001237 [Coniosporium apollinis]|uniref:NADH:ubiquinone oxidoreductase intermediate-associated protein 30 domain-containing protein n=1 Tax=Coniosporium apollinis TaxID=61459 RepID=A0ABQ9P1V3_9PEZI|nr:hypothetical protein H2201_001237 [Coniosporium apollinis]